MRITMIHRQLMQEVHLGLLGRGADGRPSVLRLQDVMQVGFLVIDRKFALRRHEMVAIASPPLFSKLLLCSGTLRMLLFRLGHLGVWEGWGDYFGRHGC